MPMKPHKGESQSDFMSRCVPEMMGDGKRDNDQAVAACLSIWREAKGEKPPPGKEGARIIAGAKIFWLDTPDEIRASWRSLHKSAVIKKYPIEQLAKIKAGVVEAWKEKIDAKGPPSGRDKVAMAALDKTVRAYLLRQEAPDPDPDESHDDFLERCVDELTDDGDMDEDDATEACQLSWEENSDRSTPPIITKEHVTTAGDDPLEFVLSDATPDRYGDIIDPKGWQIEAFKKNPIALFAHDKSFPIGTWEDVRVSNTDLRAHLKLAPLGTSSRIDEIRRLIEAKILRASSVGFRPIKFESIDPNDRFGMNGTRYLQHELVETSVVAVPANPNALAVVKSLNISEDTARLVFGEHASKQIVRRDLSAANRGEHASERIVVVEKTGEHAERNSNQGTKHMLLSKRIQDGEAIVVSLQDQLTKHLETIDDASPTEEQMLLTEDLSAKIEAATRHVNNLKSIEARNQGTAVDVTAGKPRNGSTVGKPPADLQLRTKKPEPLDYLFRAAVIRCFAKSQGQTIDDMRQKIYGDDEITRVVSDYVLKAASAPAMTTVTGWAAELVQQIYAEFMQVLLPMSVFAPLSAKGLSLTFGSAGRIIIPTRSLTPSLSGSFVGEGMPIPVRQGAFASQTLVPKKCAVITTWTKEMQDHSIPAIEGLLRQAVLEDTAVTLDTILLDANPATVIRPAGLRSYQTGLTPTAGGGFNAVVGDFQKLLGALLTLTNGNVRSPVIMMSAQQKLNLSLIQPPNAATPLFPFMTMLEQNRLLDAGLIVSATVPAGELVAVDAADFVTAGQEGPRLEISDQATLHMEDSAPADITGGTPSPATPVKSMWQTDSLALRLVMQVNWLLRRPVVSWMTGVTW
jgi:HK97 family phage prohead protease/HK97 family phage major capsid protein